MFLGRVTLGTNTVGTDRLRIFFSFFWGGMPPGRGKTEKKRESKINKGKLVMVCFSLLLRFSSS